MASTPYYTKAEADALHAELDQEQYARIAGDNNLQGQIDGIVVGGISTDTYPTQGSVKAVQSGGTYDSISVVQTGVNNEAITRSNADISLQNQITVNENEISNKVSDINHVSIELPLVDNTSDLDKPISTATQTALNGKIDDSQVLTNVPVNAVFTDTPYNDNDVLKDVDALSPVTVVNKLMTQDDVAGLGGGDMLSATYDPIINANTNKVSDVNHVSIDLPNVDNTSDLNKPVSTATQTALNGKANTVHDHVVADITDLKIPTYGAWFNSFLYVEGSGVMEMGKYMDFHETDLGNTDYDLRVTVANNNFGIGGSVSASSGNIYGNFTVEDIFKVDNGGVKVFEVNSSDGFFQLGDLPNISGGAFISGNGIGISIVVNGESKVLTTDLLTQFLTSVTINGNMGIGTTSPQSTFHASNTVGNETSVIIGASGGDNNKSARVLLNEGESGVNDSLAYGFSIAYDGFGGHYGGLTANNFAIIRHDNNTTGVPVMTIGRGSDNVTFAGDITAPNFIIGSDKRLKENIQEVDEKPINVDWKTFELKSDKGQKRYGVIAQELEEVHPEFVRTDDEGMKSVAYIDLLIAKIAELEARLNKLEN